MSGHEWASLHIDLLSTVLGVVSQLCHEAAGGVLCAADAARLLASCSPNRHWRSVALVQVHCRVRLESASDVTRVAAHPGPPCTHLVLPQPPCGQPAWKARQAEAELAEAAHQLLNSAAFQRRCSCSLTSLLNCPVVAAGSDMELLQRFPALQQLAVCDESSGRGRAGVLNLGCCPTSLHHLTLQLPGGGALRRVSLPSHLRQCEVVASSSGVGGGHCHVAPEEGAGGARFWSMCRSLQLTAAAGGLLVSLDHCHVLCSCTVLRVRGPPARGSSCGRQAAAASAAASSAGRVGADLHRWLQALMPVFTATRLQLLEVQAGAASLHTSPDGSQPLLLVGDGPSSWQPAELTAAALPSSNRQQECLSGLAAQLHGCGNQFVLSVRRCDVLP